jgi:hypothetical protein
MPLLQCLTRTDIPEAADRLDRSEHTAFDLFKVKAAW